MTPFESTLNALGPDGVANYIKAGLPDAPSMTSMLTAFKARFTLTADFRLSQNDVGYKQPTYEQLLDLAACDMTPGMTYQAELMDCDKFMKARLGWLASKGLGNLTIWGINYAIYSGTRFLAKHAACLAIDTQQRYWCLNLAAKELYDEQWLKSGVFFGGTRIEPFSILA